MLLDILLYSAEFKTDETALLAEELGLDLNRARSFLQWYKLFFREKRRKEKFRRLFPLQEKEGDWKAAVFVVLAQANSAQPTDVFRAIIGEGLKEESNQALIRIGKFAPLEDFYLWIYTHFGLSETKSPSLKEVFATMVWCHVVTCALETETILSRYEDAAVQHLLCVSGRLVAGRAGPQGAQTPGATGLSGLITMRSNLQISTLSTMIKTLKPPAFVSWAFVHTCKMTWRARYSSLTAHGEHLRITGIGSMFDL